MKNVKNTNGPSCGSLIAGTLCPQDLIPCFLEAVAEFAPAHYEGLMASAFGPIPAYVQDEGTDSPWWQSEEASALLENLTDILNEVAPEDCYFGTHPGDGSDFGWWKMNYKDSMETTDSMENRIKRMENRIKRNNWTNSEVIQLIEYCIGLSDKHKEARSQLTQMFEEFDAPLTSFSAAAFDFDQKLIVGVGPKLPR